MNLFKKVRQGNQAETSAFQYLPQGAIYLDSACQTVRPQPVIDAVLQYYRNYNACGGRVKYAWGVRVDEQVWEARQRVLAFVSKSGRDYAVAFTLNTTYGINLVLGQLPPTIRRVITSEIEHNSVFLPTMTAAKRLRVPRVVLSRSSNGALEYAHEDLTGGVVVVNSMSNFDGRVLLNLHQVADDAHRAGGIVLVDGAQSASHDIELLRSADWDALFFSGHKLYGPSLGVIVIKRALLSALDIQFVGGGLVEDVSEHGYTLLSTAEDLSSRLEAGLQDYAGIIGFNAGMAWLQDYKPEGKDARVQQSELARVLFDQLSAEPGVTLVNASPSPIVSFYSEKIEAHRLAIFLSAQNIMVRSGYFCCHYYLNHLKQYPPLVRVSLGLHNTRQQVETFTSTLKTLLASA